MKVLHISTSDTGGAGIAALRLHQGLLASGIDSKLLTQVKNRTDIEAHYYLNPNSSMQGGFIKKMYDKVKRMMIRHDLYFHPYFSRVKKYLKNQPAGHEMFSFPFAEFGLSKNALVKEADVINLHWVSGGFLDYKRFFSNIKKPIVWTLHDMNPFTGGCHYAEECMGYTMACHSCPQLKNTVDDEYAAKMFLLKGKLFDRINPECLCVVTPSKWLGHCAQDSRMFRKFPKKVIEYGFDEHVFFPRDKNECRIKLGLPVDKKIILFASQSLINERKGMKYLISALRELQDENILLVSMGGTDDLSFDKNIMVNLGYINDEATAAIVYNSADVFVSPSLADNFPNTVCESMLCGTAVVAFSVGGISEQVTHETGLLAELKNTRSLKENIQFVLNNPEKYPAKIISKIATERWRLTLQAEKYIAVYKSLLN